MKKDEYEMSQQVDTTNYEEKYKQALERARISRLQLLDIGEEATEIEHIFPELKESEDEKIKRCISDVVRKYGIEFATGTITKEKMLAWLEKQGEQKPTWSKNDEDALDVQTHSHSRKQ